MLDCLCRFPRNSTTLLRLLELRTAFRRDQRVDRHLLGFIMRLQSKAFAEQPCQYLGYLIVVQSGGDHGLNVESLHAEPVRTGNLAELYAIRLGNPIP